MALLKDCVITHIDEVIGPEGHLSSFCSMMTGSSITSMLRILLISVLIFLS
jgi:hypothetical protein